VEEIFLGRDTGNPTWHGEEEGEEELVVREICQRLQSF
jgi:hypothetical protein